MANLTDLLRYKKKVEIRGFKGEVEKTVWVRVLGDFDLNEAYRAARIASSRKRKALRDPTTSDYQDEVESAADLTLEEKIELIKTARTNGFIAEARSNVIRPELPELDEVSSDPDAATLEDMEKLDKRLESTESVYQKELQQYIDDKLAELESNLRVMPEEELLEVTKLEVSNIIPYSMFLSELSDQKAYYGTFEDQTCKIKSFETVKDFKNAHKYVKDQILLALNTIELGSDDLKN